MRQFPPIKAIIFDLDDTLIDWADFDGNWHQMELAHLNLVYRHVTEAGCPLDSPFEAFQAAYRERTMNAWADARTNLRAPQMVRILMATLHDFGFVPNASCNEQTCIAAYQWAAVSTVKVFEDVPSGLEKLNELGIKIGILTNSSQPMHLRKAELIAFDLLRHFQDEDLLVSAADIGYLKPHPRVFEHMLERTGTKAEETLYVGDNPVADIAGAQGAGLRAVLRVNHPSPTLISGLIVPDAAVNNFMELLNLVQNWEAYASAS